MDRTVPVVDLALPDLEVAEQLHHACSNVGFFHVVNTNIPPGCLEACFEQCRLFFALPDEQKRRILADQNNRGYTPYQEETLNPGTQSEGDTKEGLYFGRDIPPGSPEAAKPLHGPNQWPDEELLPDFRPAVQAYFDACTELGYRLVKAFAQSLDVSPEWFRRQFEQPMLFLRPLHYSAVQSRPEDGVFGAGAHSDYGLMTILATDGTPGLEILHDGEWMPVQHVEGAVLINLGDMAERWTNGYYKSTLHRVVSTSGKDRYSLPFFFEPSFDTEVASLPSCTKLEPAKYLPCTAGQHLLQKYAATHALFADGEEE